MTIYGDGNCLARCGSFLVYGNEEHHLEMRGRIVMELAVHEDFYLRNRQMVKGCRIESSPNVPKMFAMVSEHLEGGKLGPVKIKNVLEREIVAATHPATYMGLWQVAALSSVLGRPVVSVYPQYAGHILRNECNRTFYPRSEMEGISAHPVHIMWTHTEGKKAT